MTDDFPTDDDTGLDDTAGDNQPEQPATRGKRFMELAKMTGSVAGNYAKSKIGSWFRSDDDQAAHEQHTQRKNGELVAETLGNLKGAAMKIGQMASVATDILPDQLAEPLESLQRDAPPMSYSVIAEQIERELGAAPEILFDSFEREPFASASIGQVHRAVVDDGRQVVVKVQYPGVDESVDSDIGQLRFALRVSGFIDSGRKEAFDRLFDEIEARLEEELDYTLEADHVRLFQKIHADDDWIAIPEVVGERSAKRVLTLTELDGLSLEEIIDQGDQSLRDRVGQNIFRTFAAQMFRDGTLHADPNPANFAFRQDGTLLLYDFGCIKDLSEQRAQTYRQIIRAALKRRADLMEPLMQKLGARVPDTEAVPEWVYEKWWDLAFEPLIADEYYDYGESTVHERVIEHADSFAKHGKAFQPPEGGAYIDRTVLGVHNILRKLEARIRWRGLLEEYLPEVDLSEVG
jgi:predicted unusual protein kinase regulating ubiquinone biosynthesis (AarF/ABC1/UbiB family)